MKIIGLTGPTGAGKGLACEIFAKYGIPSIDTDALYHALLSESDALKRELVWTFGTEILQGDKIDRKKLAKTVFGRPETPSLLHGLNEITHKYVMARTHELVQDHKAAGAAAVLIDAPQLFEAKIENECDLVVGILAPAPLRLARIMARDGISREDAERRMQAQHDEHFFRKHCDVILENDGAAAILEGKIRLLLDTIVPKKEN